MFRCLTVVLLLAAFLGLVPQTDAGIFTVRTGLGQRVAVVDDFGPDLNFLALGGFNPSVTVVGARVGIFNPLVVNRGLIFNPLVVNRAVVVNRGLFVNPLVVGRRTVIFNRGNFGVRVGGRGIFGF